MDLSHALTRRILHGDIEIKQEGERKFVAYDSIRIEMVVGRRIAVSLMAGKVELASIDIEFERFINGSSIQVRDLEGRLELTDNEFAPIARSHIFP